MNQIGHFKAWGVYFLGGMSLGVYVPGGMCPGGVQGVSNWEVYIFGVSIRGVLSGLLGYWLV